MKRIIATVAAAIAVLGGAAASASAASAHPAHPAHVNACATGIYTGYCGTQVDGNGLSLIAGLSGSIFASRHPFANGNFFWFAYDGGGNKIAEWAPDGVASGLVMAGYGSHVVLEQGTGALNEQWIFEDGAWANAANGKILETHGYGPVTEVTPPVSLSPSETFTFVIPL